MTNATLPNRCPTCGSHFPEEIHVCPTCRTILVTPPKQKKTPGWVIALLVSVIIVLFIYAIYLAYHVLVLHEY
ncbi:MAG: hypothetical protein ACYDBB_15735 [Armatimonadota bacterium]